MKTLKEHVSPAVSAPAKEELLQDLVPVGSEPAAASRTPATPPRNRTGPTSSAQPLCPPCAVWWSVHSMITSVRWGKQSFSWNNFPCYSPQVRINFESLTLSDPDATGMCKTEYVQVTKGVKIIINNNHQSSMCRWQEEWREQRCQPCVDLWTINTSSTPPSPTSPPDSPLLQTTAPQQLLTDLGESR